MVGKIKNFIANREVLKNIYKYMFFFYGILVVGMLTIYLTDYSNRQNLDTRSDALEIEYIINLFKKDDSVISSKDISYILAKGPNAVQSIISSINTVVDAKKSQMLYVLGELKDSSSLTTIKTFLTSNNPYVKRNAIIALTKFNNPILAVDLKAGLNDSNLQVKQDVISALIELNDNTSAKSLLEIYDSSKEESTKKLVIQYFVKNSDNSLESRMVNDLSGKFSIEFKRSIIDSLSKLSTKSVVPAIQKYINSLKAINTIGFDSLIVDQINQNISLAEKAIADINSKN